jgi:hypothetical protein
MSKILELIADMQDYGYDITTDKKVSNKTLADYLEFHIVGVVTPIPVNPDESEIAERNFQNGKESMRRDVLCILKEVESVVFPAHKIIVQDIICKVEML